MTAIHTNIMQQVQVYSRVMIRNDNNNHKKRNLNGASMCSLSVYTKLMYNIYSENLYQGCEN